MARVTPIRSDPSSSTLLESVRAATRPSVMPWLKPSDQAMVAMALHLAATIDDAVEAGRGEAAGWMYPHLANMLKSLGGAPAERRALGAKDVGGGKLAGLRAARE